MRKLNYASWFLTFIVVMVCVSSPVSAQLQPGMVDMRPSMNTTMTNTINTARTRILSGSGGSVANQRIVSAGQQKIKAGRATTTFTYSPTATKSLAKSLNWTGDGPYTLPEQVKYISDLTNKFNKMISENGLTINDSADARVMAYAIASYISTNKKPSPSSLNQMRQNLRRNLLSDPYYQGSSDQLKQETYELYSNYAMQAIKAIEKSQQARSNSEKQAERNKAVSYANTIISSVNESLN